MNFKYISLLMLIIITIAAMLMLASCGGDDDESSSLQSSQSQSESEQTPPAPVIDTTVKKIEIDYDMTYTGVSLKDLSALFDEQKLDPVNHNGIFPSSFVPYYDYNNDGDPKNDDNSEFEITIDLEVKKHISHVYLFYKGTGQTIKVEAGTAFKYETAKNLTVEEQAWNKLDVDADTQYLNFTFKNGQAPYEILVYGYDLGEAPKAAEGKHVNKTIGYMLGMNGHSQANKSSELECTSYFRDYKTWTFGYNTSIYPKAASFFNGTYHTAMNVLYKALLNKNTESVPCFMFDATGTPAHIEGSDKNLPESYMMYAEFVYQYTLRYGNNPSNTTDLVKELGKNPRVNLNLIKWIEIGNEPNGEDSHGYTPYQLAAFTSAAYDGHCNTMTAPSGSGVGIVNADPNIKVAMSGLAGVQYRYIKAMCFWLEHNRPDGKVSMEAFNVHTYCRKTIEYNGYTIEIGVSPEAGDLAGSLANIINYRNKYYPEMELWLTEFGWDTNQSYLTEGSSHAYGPYTGRQVQAMWLTRAYFILSSIGVDRAAMYMCRDVGAEETSVGKYGTSGVVTHNGSEKKDSYYYLYTLKSTMSDMYFVEEIDSGNEDVWIYKFENGKGKTCYAVWCPTSDNVRVDNFKLNVGTASSVTLTEMAYGEIAGVSSPLTVSNGAVSVNVSECPILVFAE